MGKYRNWCGHCSKGIDDGLSFCDATCWSADHARAKRDESRSDEMQDSADKLTQSLNDVFDAPNPMLRVGKVNAFLECLDDHIQLKLDQDKPVDYDEICF